MRRPLPGSRPLVVLLVSVLGVAGVPANARADDPPGDRRTLDLLPQNLAKIVAGLADHETVTPLVIGGLATGAARAFDEEVRRAVAHPGTTFGRVVDRVAGPVGSSLLVGALFVAGQAADDARFKAMTYDMACATLVTAGVTAVIKLAVRRTRPNLSNRRSFPSGHTSNAFALAAVVGQHYGWKGGVPAYAAASAIGLSRVMEDQHYASDVVAAGTVGYLVGTTTVRVNSEPSGSPAAPPPAPVSSPAPGLAARGFQVSFTF